MAKYQEWLTGEKLTLLQGWARDGLTDKQIAANMGIAESTFYVWASKYKEFSEYIKKGKEVADYEVENALYKSALGYDTKERTYERHFNRKTGEYEMVCVKETVKHIPPSNTAQIFWLKNRRGDKWRDKQPNESNGEALELMYKNLDLTEDAAKNETVTDAE